MKIKIYLDYKCYPVWIYSDTGSFVDNDLPKELLEDKELDERFMNLQKTYDNLFTDDGVEFKFNGFSKEIEREAYLFEMEQAVDELKVKAGENYAFEVKLNI
jgi:hypothetical protein